jgi:hypothetical protein
VIIAEVVTIPIDEPEVRSSSIRTGSDDAFPRDRGLVEVAFRIGAFLSGGSQNRYHVQVVGIRAVQSMACGL